MAGDVNRDSDSRLATQFLVASKTFANGITLSVEQALAGADTVGRASYRLSRRWSVDLKGGAVNGIALVYRTFSGTRKGRSPKRWRASPGAATDRRSRIRAAWMRGQLLGAVLPLGIKSGLSIPRAPLPS